MSKVIRTIKFKNPKIRAFLELKANFIEEGRKISIRLEKIDDDIKECEAQERKYTEAQEIPQSLLDHGNSLVEQINALEDQMKPLIDELQKSKEEAEQIKRNAIPAHIVEEHNELKKEKESLEQERTKKAGKVQKIKDRLSPLVRKVVGPMIEDKYQDINTVEISGENLTVDLFSYLEDWKDAFDGKNKLPIADEENPKITPFVSG